MLEFEQENWKEKRWCSMTMTSSSAATKNSGGIHFYEKMGYAADGERAPLPELGEGCCKMRMIEIAR